MPEMHWTDYFRLANIGLCLIIAGGLLFDRASPWRRINSTWRLTFTMIALVFIWLAWGSLEAHAMDVPSNGSRVWGFTVILILVLTSLIIQSIRAHRADTEFGSSPGPGGNYREPAGGHHARSSESESDHPAAGG